MISLLIPWGADWKTIGEWLVLNNATLKDFKYKYDKKSELTLESAIMFTSIIEFKNEELGLAFKLRFGFKTL